MPSNLSVINKQRLRPIELSKLKGDQRPFRQIYFNKKLNLKESTMTHTAGDSLAISAELGSHDTYDRT